ncbi:MAG: PhoU domain-containing protein [Thermoprotei archaeon]
MAEVKATRKIQLTGGSTYIVSLPKEWVKYFNLKAGDEIEIRSDPYMRLIITPKDYRVQEKRAFPSVDCEKENVEMLVRDVISYYMAGSEGVNVKVRCLSPDEREVIKSNIRSRLLGAEIVDENNEVVSIQFVVSYKDLGINTAINRAFTISSNMLKDDLRAMKNRRPEEALDVKFRDNEVDRFYFYVVRLLSQGSETLESLKNDGYNASQVVNVFSVIRSIERISDHATRISENIQGLMMGDYPDTLVEWGYSVLEVYTKAMNAFMSRKKSQASDVIVRSSTLREGMWVNLIKNATLVSKPEQLLSAALIVDSLSRITRYSMDIAEATIDLIAKQEMEA